MGMTVPNDSHQFGFTKMSHAFPHFHPNPGWTKPDTTSDFIESGHSSDSVYAVSVPNLAITDTIGKHCILELYDCDCVRLDDELFVRSAITNAALRAGATLLNLITHHFKPHGVTGLALLAESHISIHTWPESGYAAVDVFTCGDHTMPESACRVLMEELGAKRHALRSFRRETPGQIAAVDREPTRLNKPA